MFYVFCSANYENFFYHIAVRALKKTGQVYFYIPNTSISKQIKSIILWKHEIYTVLSGSPIVGVQLSSSVDMATVRHLILMTKC